MIFFYDEMGAPTGFKFRTSQYDVDEFDYYFYEKNLFGDIVAIYNENGTKIGSYLYDAWGNFTSSYNNSVDANASKIINSYNPFRYRGYFYDHETGLYYLQSRYYNPQWGRFINADGIIGTGGFLGFNLYAYCVNNPITFYDPCGTCVHNRIQGEDCDICREARRNAEMLGIPYEGEPPEEFYKIKPTDDEGNVEDRDGNARLILSASLATLTTGFNLLPDNAGSVVGMSVFTGIITVPMSAAIRFTTPDLTRGQQWVLFGYDVAVFAGGAAISYAVVNCWNPSGWIVAGITVTYSVVTFLTGWIIENEMVDYNARRSLQ